MANSSSVQIIEKVSEKNSFVGLKPAEFRNFWEGLTPLIQPMVSSPAQVQQVIQAAILISQDDNLINCQPLSVVSGVLTSLTLDLSLYKPLSQFYLMSFSTKQGALCQSVIGYNGWKEIVFRTGFIKSFQARTVLQGDTFKYEHGSNPYLSHIVNGSSERPISHVYCEATTVQGQYLFEVMDFKAIEKLRRRNKSQGENPAHFWATDYAAMAKAKCTRPFLRSSFPMSNGLAAALNADETVHFSEMTVSEAVKEGVIINKTIALPTDDLDKVLPEDEINKVKHGLEHINDLPGLIKYFSQNLEAWKNNKQVVSLFIEKCTNLQQLQGFYRSFQQELKETEITDLFIAKSKSFSQPKDAKQ